MNRKQSTEFDTLSEADFDSEVIFYPDERMLLLYELPSLPGIPFVNPAQERERRKPTISLGTLLNEQKLV